MPSVPGSLAGMRKVTSIVWASSERQPRFPTEKPPHPPAPSPGRAGRAAPAGRSGLFHEGEIRAVNQGSYSPMWFPAARRITLRCKVGLQIWGRQERASHVRRSISCCCAALRLVQFVPKVQTTPSARSGQIRSIRLGKKRRKEFMAEDHASFPRRKDHFHSQKAGPSLAGWISPAGASLRDWLT